MIYESHYWKTELIKLSKKLTKRIGYKRFWTDAQNGAFEKEIMIGFYIVRKLIESQKLPNRLVSTKIIGRKFPNNDTTVHLMNTHKFYEHYDFHNGKTEKFDLRFLINQIVHSYIFSPDFYINEENGEMTLSGIHFCSDDQRNNWIYELNLTTVIGLFEKIGNSPVTNSSMTFDNNKKDYRVIHDDEVIQIPKEDEEILRLFRKRK
jgi:hypothetical protein